MILILRVHRLRRPIIRLIHDPHTRSPDRTLPPTRSRPSRCNPHRIPHPYHHYRRRRPPLMSRTYSRGKNRCNPGPTKPNIIHHNPTRSLLWPMLRNLRGQPQLHAYRSRIHPPHPLRSLILTTIILIIKKLCTPALAF